MPVIHKSALVIYTVKQMFELVEDVGSYPEFVPWVSSTSIIQQDAKEVIASIELKKGPIQRAFTTRNELRPYNSMTINLTDGPFKYLKGEWQFLELGNDGSKVTLDMDFEFSSRILSMTIGPIFNDMVNHLVDAFVKRAPEIYDKR